MDISVMCILIINAKIWTTYLLFVKQCMHLVYQEIHLKPFLYMWTIMNVYFLGHLLLFDYNKEPEQRCMTDHRIKNNPLSSFENKQRSVSNISYMVFFPYFTIYGVIITGLYQAQDVLYRTLPNLYPELSVLTLYPISVNA
jgi:hypothetical protein